MSQDLHIHRFVKNLLLSSTAFALLGLTVLSAHEGEENERPQPKLAAVAEVWKPSAVPDRIVLSWKEAPATSQAVNWRTDTTVFKGLAEVVKATGAPIKAEDAEQYQAKTSLLFSDLNPAHYHSVNFRNLEPKTKYAYRVGDGVNWSEWSHFITASEDPEPFTFVYFGDAQNALKEHWSRVVREAFIDAPRAAFFLHAGDLVNTPQADADWGEWFYSGGFINRTIPVIATPGNHEYYKEKDEDGTYTVYHLTDHWRPSFTFPEHGPSELEESVYYIDYQGVRIISLNSNERQEDQIPWLDHVLKNNPHKWTVLTFHHPVYSPKVGRDNPTMRGNWQPLIDKYKVDIVLTGHDHTYARTGLMVAGDEDPEKASENTGSGATVRNAKTGTMYVVSVSGPKMYDVEKRHFMHRVAEDTQLYQIIKVDGNQLHYEARTAVGEIYDGFTIKKQDGKPNKLIDEIPETPENRRPPKEEEEEN